MAIAALALAGASVPAAGQPSGGEYFPLVQSPGAFDPAAAVGAVTDAAADRDNSSAAFSGLAERVQVDLLLGQATSRIPIELPPGRNLTPSLALTYGSRGGNGLFGRGWDLRWPCVKRTTKDGVPIDYDDPTGAYLPPGSAEFVLVLPTGTVPLDKPLSAPGAVVQRYASEAEEAFVRADFDTIANRWVVTTTDGVQWTFGGGSGQTRLGPAVGFASYTFAWGVTEVRDPNDNTITFTYHPYGLSGASNAAFYPNKITYGANPVAGYADTFHACFSYNADGQSCTGATARPDQPFSYLGGFDAHLLYRVHAIKVWVTGESTEAAPTRRYVFQYVSDALTQETKLQQVHLFDASNTSLRPTTFTYNGSTAALSTGTTNQFFTRLQWPLRRNVADGGTDSDLIDMTGDGRLDWVECGPGPAREWYVYRNLGNNSFGPRETWTPPWEQGYPSFCGLRGQFWDLIDIDGDGRPDLLANGGISAPPHVYLNSGSGFAERVPWSFPTTVNSYEVNPSGWGGIRDLNGDGLPDFIHPDCDCEDAGGTPMYCPGTEGYCRVFLNTGAGFDTVGTLWSWPLINGFPGKTTEFDVNDGRTKHALLDLTGDGLPDLVVSRPAWEVYVNTGRGFSLDPLPWPGAPGMDLEQACGQSTSPKGWPPIGLEGALRDMNGDGLLDYVDANVVCSNPAGGGPWQVYVNTGTGFRPPIAWANTQGLLVQRWDSIAPTRVVASDILDINGDGVADYVEAAAGHALPPLGPFGRRTSGRGRQISAARNAPADDQRPRRSRGRHLRAQYVCWRHGPQRLLRRHERRPGVHVHRRLSRRRLRVLPGLHTFPLSGRDGPFPHHQ